MATIRKVFCAALCVTLGGCIPKSKTKEAAATPTGSGPTFSLNAKTLGKPGEHCPQGEGLKGRRVLVVSFARESGEPSMANYIAGSLLAPSHHHINSKEVVALRHDDVAVSSDAGAAVYQDISKHYQQNLIPEILSLDEKNTPMRVKAGTLQLDEQVLQLCVVHLMPKLAVGLTNLLPEVNRFMPESILMMNLDNRSNTLAIAERFTENRWYHDEMSTQVSLQPLLLVPALGEAKSYSWSQKDLAEKARLTLRAMQSDFSIEARDYDTPGSAVGNNFGYLMLHYVQDGSFAVNPELGVNTETLQDWQDQYKSRQKRLKMHPTEVGLLHLPTESEATLQGDDQSMVTVWVRVVAQMFAG